MASGTFFNPKTALLAAPLVSSTCTLWFASDQDFFLKMLIHKDFNEDKESIITSYMRIFFPTGLPSVIAPLAVTFWTSLAAMRVARPLLQARGSLGWYVGAATLAMGHLAWVPAVAWKLKTMVGEGKAEEEGTTNTEVLRAWLRVNWWRMVTTDLPAWLCCVVAVTKTLSVDL